MYKTLLVTLFAALATAQVTKLNKSQVSTVLCFFPRESMVLT